jgi:uncharacterized surface protein with fasciclin (FAS1) repeats
MRKSLLFVLLIVCGYHASAQTTDTTFRSPENELTTFYKVVNITGMDSIFKSSIVTIFAPDNKAFEKLPQLDSLVKTQNKTALSNLLNDHIITGKFTIKDITGLIHQNNGQTEFTTVSGNKLTARINSNRNIVLTDANGNESVIKVFNISRGSSTLYIISSVISTPKL